MTRFLRRAWSLVRQPRSIARRGRRWLGRQPWARRIVMLARDVRLMTADPRLGVALLREDLTNPTDISVLPLLARALTVRRSAHLLRRQAELLTTAGEPSAALVSWRELAGRGSRRAARRARLVEGRLTETDTSWLPTLAGPSERLEPVSRTRILHLTKSAVPERWSGFTIRTLQNLRAQRAAGLEPIVVTKLGWPREAGVSDVPEQVSVEGFEHHYIDRGPDYRPRSLPVDVPLQDLAEDLVPLVRRLRPAVLHVHSGHRGGELALVALALRARLGVPVVYEVRGLFEATWSSDPRVAESAEVYRRRLAQETRILSEVDGVVAISEALADQLAGRGIPRTKITVVPNGIDPEALGSRARDPDLRRQLGLDGRFVVGYLGNLDHWREGIEGLVTALAELRRRGRRDVALLVVGDGVRRSAIEEHAARLGVADACRFTGRVPHELVGAYYAQMDLFTNPRVDERAARYITPLKPYEAMALGIPVLVTDLPALREIVDPPARGAVAPVGNPVALAAAIERLKDDPPERARLATAARTWVRSERTWLANGPRYLAAYEAVLGPIDVGGSTTAQAAPSRS